MWHKHRLRLAELYRDLPIIILGSKEDEKEKEWKEGDIAREIQLINEVIPYDFLNNTEEKSVWNVFKNITSTILFPPNPLNLRQVAH